MRTATYTNALEASAALLNRLIAVEGLLPQLLWRPDVCWHSCDVVYHPPRVERLWCDLSGEHTGFRLNLHRIHPCDPKQALLHPHPWPSAMRIVRGRYLHAIGYGSGTDAPPVAALVVQEQGSVYAMVEPDGWHAVSPVREPAYTVMLSGAPWERWSPKPGPQPPMTQDAMRALMGTFRGYYR